MINTLLGVVIDTDRMLPHLGGLTGGLSGPAVRPVAVRAVWQVHHAMPHVPIVGMGGIRTGLDAFEFILAGASAVQVGTALFNDPSAPVRVARELQQVLGDRGFKRVTDAIGHAHRGSPQSSQSDSAESSDSVPANDHATDDPSEPT
jgi:dihydroorotate dehydrogenase (NAD+) catalytic subunit